MLMHIGFDVLNMRANGLMRGRELNTDVSHQVGPTGFKCTYSTTTRNVVCCLKISSK